MQIEEIDAKIEDLQKRHAAVSKRKAELAGELKAKKEELGALVKEIKAAGYDAKTLKEDRDRAQAELEALVAKFDTELKQAEDGIAAYDAKK